MHNEATDKTLPEKPRFHVGVVSFFNARPLIYGLEKDHRLVLQHQVPARLPEGIDRGEFDTALVPSIDYQRPQSHWCILPAGVIASPGDVLTVRVFSQVPFEKITCLACDTDSHTSVVLAQIIWHMRFAQRLQIRPLVGATDTETAVLLIGDKVIPELPRWRFQLDLGQAWTELTNLPFVYAFWAAPVGKNIDPLPAILQQACRQGLKNIESVVEQYASQHGFPNELGLTYFTRNLSYHLGPREKAALEKFYSIAHELGLTKCRRPLRIYSRVGAGTIPSAVTRSNDKPWPIPTA